MDPVGRRTRSSQQTFSKLGLSMRQGNRVPLGEISSNTESGLEPRRPQKVQGFAIFDDENAQSSVFEGTQKGNFSSVQSFSDLAGGSSGWGASIWNNPRKQFSFDVRPEGHPVALASSYAPRFTIHNDESPPKRPALAPIGSEVALSKSLLHDATFAMENDENVKPALPDCERHGFRQSADFILSSPVSDGDAFEVSASEDSPMATEEIVQVVDQIASESIFDVEEYSLDIVNHLKRAEQKFMPKWNYMTKQPDITFSMRSILVDWLVEVGEEYKLHTETLFLAVNYIDRFLSFMSVQRAKLQLVGTACMFVAAKYEEIYPPDVSEFCYITDDTYTKKQVLRMEHLVLDVLKFECSPPTAHFFANHFSKMSGLADKSNATFLAQYLVELTLLEAETFLHFFPSVIGAASVALSRHTLGQVAWEESMVEKSGYKVDDFRDCLVCLHTTFSKASEFPQQAIREKYKNEKYNMVAMIAPTPIF